MSLNAARKSEPAGGTGLRSIVRIVRLEEGRRLGFAKDFGPKPQVVWIDVVLLRIDDAYQRPIDYAGRAQILRIAKGFEWRKFSPLVVVPIESGFYAVIDGQHRAHAAAICNIRSVPCYVVSASQEEQAQCFAAINGQITSIKTQNLWKARRAAGDAEACAIERIASLEDVEIIWFNLSTRLMRRPRQCCAINAIARVLRQHGEDVARLVLFALCSTVPARDRTYLTAQWIDAAAFAFGRHPEIRDRALISKCCARLDLGAEEAANREARRGYCLLSGWALCVAAILEAFGIREAADKEKGD